MNKLLNETEYIVQPEGLQEITFKREPMEGETDCDVCNIGDSTSCQYCDYQGLLPC